MSALLACRMCLAVEVRLYTIANTPLQNVYERLTNIPLQDGDKKPDKVCNICCHLLRKNQAFMEMTVKADELLQLALEKGIELTDASMRMKEMARVHSSFCISPPKLTDFVPEEQATDFELQEDTSTEIVVKVEPLDIKVEIEVEENSDQFLKEDQCLSAVEADTKMMHQNISARSEDQSTVRPSSVVTSRNDETKDPQTTINNNLHSLDNPYRCSHCDKGFDRRYELEHHILLHTGERPHRCTHCDKAFIHKSALTRHIRTHTGEKPHRCSHCEKAFNRKYDLEQHVLLHTEDKPHRCRHCDKAFNQKSSILKHMLTHPGVKPHPCSYCSEAFNQKRELNEHILIHTGKKTHQCSYCNKAFTHMSFLKQHILIHTGEKPYRCSHCNKRFRHKSYLTEHILIHTGEKPQQCSYCDKAFTHKSVLIRHNQQVHPDEKPYGCSFCKLAFSHKSVLLHHIKSLHTSGKPR